MKLYKVELTPVDYDTYDSCIIAAENINQVFNLITDNKKHGEDFCLSENQNVSVKEIKLEEIKIPVILISSFNAG